VPVPVPPDCPEPPQAATQSMVMRARAMRIWRGPAEGLIVVLVPPG
jgi:hypothetical protein